MNIKMIALALAGATMGLSGCVTDGYGPGYGSGYGMSMGIGSPYAYDGWYDGYYGSIYDGYWGRDDYFYYRNRGSDRRFRRGDRHHFMRRPPQGEHHYRPFKGEMRPPRGANMPHFGGRPPRSSRPGWDGKGWNTG